MNAPNLFLRAVESSRAREHEARLSTRNIEALPDDQDEGTSHEQQLATARARQCRERSRVEQLRTFRACRADGMAPAEIAERLGVSERQVYRLIKQVEPRPFGSLS